jgi:hypothetical protein
VTHSPFLCKKVLDTEITKQTEGAIPISSLFFLVGDLFYSYVLLPLGVRLFPGSFQIKRLYEAGSSVKGH